MLASRFEGVMGRFYRAILFTTATTLLVSRPLMAISLNRIIGDAVTHNPQQQANDLTVESYNLDAEGTHKDAIYPQVNISAGETRNQYNQTLPGTNNMNAGVSATETVYDGRAALDNAKSLAWEAKAQQALYESTDPYVPYTAGSVASQVFNLYVSWASYLATRDLNQKAVDFMQDVLPLTDDPKALALLKSSIQSDNDQISANNKNMNSTFADLCYYSFTKLPPTIDDFEQTNAQMKQDLEPYKDVQKAIITAKQRNYDYLARLYQLKQTIYQDRATRATLTRPVVTITLGDSWNEDQTIAMGTPPMASDSPYVGVEVTMPISFGLRDHLQASHYRVLAAEKQVRQQEADFTYTIESTFRKLYDVDAETSEFDATTQADYILISGFIQQHVSHHTAFTYNDVIQLSSLLNNWAQSNMNYIGAISQAITFRYNLEVAIGILFDSAGYHHSPNF